MSDKPTQKGMNRRNHHDSLSQSGQKRRGQTPPPQRGRTGGTFYSPTVNSIFFGRNPTVRGHGPGKRKRK